MDKLGQEWVSAAVDGEVEPQAMAELAGDQASHNKWRNYHLIGDTLRAELPETINLDLSAKVAEALEAEPAMVAPEYTNTQKQPDEQQMQAVSKIVPLFKQFGQYAIAASVALIAVVGVQNYSKESTAGDASPLPVLTTRPLVGSVSPVSLQASPPVREHASEQMYEQRRRLNSYIQDHMLQQRLNVGAVVDEGSDETSNDR